MTTDKQTMHARLAQAPWTSPFARMRPRTAGLPLLILLGLLAGCRTVDTDDAERVIHPQSAAEFHHLLRDEDQPILAVFVSQGCGTCRLAGTILSTLASDYDGTLTVVEADLGLMGELIGQYDLIKVPTAIVFREGLEVRRRQGILPAPFMRGFIDQALAAERPGKRH